MMITGHGLLNTRVVPFFVTEAPPPRRLRGFPLPLWRGVNGLANYGLIGLYLPRDALSHGFPSILHKYTKTRRKVNIYTNMGFKVYLHNIV